MGITKIHFEKPNTASSEYNRRSLSVKVESLLSAAGTTYEV